MLNLRTVATLTALALLAACGAKPEKSIAKDCVRLNMLADLGGSGDQKKSCTCFADKLEDTMSEKDLKALAKALKDSKTEDEFESHAEANGLSDASAMTMMGAAKSCALGQ